MTTPSDAGDKIQSPASRRGLAEIGDRVTGRSMPSRGIPLEQRYWLLPRYRLRDQASQPDEHERENVGRIMRELPLSASEAAALRAELEAA